MIEPGEALFIPIGWFHYVEGLDTTLGKSFTGFAWDNDYDSFYTSRGDCQGRSSSFNRPFVLSVVEAQSGEVPFDFDTKCRSLSRACRRAQGERKCANAIEFKSG